VAETLERSGHAPPFPNKPHATNITTESSPIFIFVFLFLLVLRLRSSKRLFRSTGEIPESQRN
jgi:hypothetical protein